MKESFRKDFVNAFDKLLTDLYKQNRLTHHFIAVLHIFNPKDEYFGIEFSLFLTEYSKSDELFDYDYKRFRDILTNEYNFEFIADLGTSFRFIAPKETIENIAVLGRIG
ncbi:MAG: hypothetical protein J5691_00790 [Bacilli bacterium]|nr:hypothetical protein [Bacilli bacterium]